MQKFVKILLKFSKIFTGRAGHGPAGLRSRVRRRLLGRVGHLAAPKLLLLARLRLRAWSADDLRRIEL